MHKIGKKRKIYKLKTIVSWLHLWPGLIAGIFILIICLSGTLLVYADEIMDYTAGDAKYVEVVKSERITYEEIIDHMQQKYPDFIISEFVFFKNPKRSIRLRCYNAETRDISMIYMDPYTGKIIKKDKTIFIFFMLAHFHANFLAGPIGNWLVIIASVIFLSGCVSGLYLWWPKKWNKTTKKRHFSIKWKAKFRRLNYDLHNVLGFYALIPAMVLAITGLMISFPSFMNFTIHSTGSNLKPLLEVLPKIDSTKTSKNLVPFAYDVLNHDFPDKEAVSIRNFDVKRLGAYVFTSGSVGLKSIEDADICIYDRYTGKRIQIEKGYIDNEKTRNFIWQIHMGNWCGQFGKLLTFLVGLIATSLSITGFLIWWHKRQKKSFKSKP